MAQDILSLALQQLTQDGLFQRLARDPRAQFGTVARPYLGPTLLPEVEVATNAYREDQIRFRTVIASAGTRYSPAQRRSGGYLIASFLVELGYSDISVEMTAREYDGLVRLLQTGRVSMEAMAAIIQFVDRGVVRALVEENERMRWEVIVNGQTVRKGDNGYTETVTYADPAGHRVNAAGTWSSDAYDPYDDIMGRAQLLWDKGYEVNRIITSRRVLGILAGNAKFAARAANIRVLSNSDVIGRVTRAQMDALMAAEDLPAFETYDLRYNTETAEQRFLADNAMVFVATTGRDDTVDWGEDQRFVPSTVGYTAIGIGAGQQAPGRAIYAASFQNKPPRIEAEGWQASLPVVTEPEAFACVKLIA